MIAIAQALSAALLHFVWQGLLVAFLLWTALFLLRRRSAEARYRVSCAALALLAVLPVITALAVYTPPAQAVAAAASAGVAPQPGGVWFTAGSPPTLWLQSLASWALPVWSLGVLLFSLRLVWGFQIFQVWIRPVEPPTACFALRLALYQLNKLIRYGIPDDGFERTRDFLMKYANVLTRTGRAELGYLIDSSFYSRPKYTWQIQTALAKLTREDVNRAIRLHLRTDRVVIVAVSKNADELKRLLASGEPSPMTYNSPKPDAIREEDKAVEKWGLNLRPEDIKVVPVSEVFQ